MARAGTQGSMTLHSLGSRGGGRGREEEWRRGGGGGRKEEWREEGGWGKGGKGGRGEAKRVFEHGYLHGSLVPRV